MHATIDVRFTISIDKDKTVPLATLAEVVTDQNVESVLLEALVESLDAANKLGRQVEQFKQKAKEAAEEQADYQCQACDARFHTEYDECSECSAQDITSQPPTR